MSNKYGLISTGVKPGFKVYTFFIHCVVNQPRQNEASVSYLFIFVT